MAGLSLSGGSFRICIFSDVFLFFCNKGICWKDTMEVLTIMTRSLRYAYFDVDCDWFV